VGEGNLVRVVGAQGKKRAKEMESTEVFPEAHTDRTIDAVRKRRLGRRGSVPGTGN